MIRACASIRPMSQPPILLGCVVAHSIFVHASAPVPILRVVLHWVSAQRQSRLPSSYTPLRAALTDPTIFSLVEIEDQIPMCTVEPHESWTKLHATVARFRHMVSTHILGFMSVF